MCILWDDVGLNYTVVGCREKHGEQLTWTIGHVGMGLDRRLSNERSLAENRPLGTERNVGGDVSATSLDTISTDVGGRNDMSAGCVEVMRLKKDTELILATMVLRRLRLDWEDLEPNETLYMITLPYIADLDVSRKTAVDLYPKTLHVSVSIKTIRRFSHKKGKRCCVKRKSYDGFYLD